MMDGDYRFSVIMSVYAGDRACYFDRAVTSVIQQTVMPDEIVIVLDGPVDEDIHTIISAKQQRYGEKIRFSVLALKRNMGLGHALNVAVRNCSNEYIARMDSDDISVKERFEKQLACFKKMKDISLVGGYIYEFTDSLRHMAGVREVPEMDREIKKYAKSRSPFNHVTVMFRRTDVLNAGNYRDWYCNEDYDLWIRMIEKGMMFYNLPENLVYVRVGKEMYKRRGGKQYFDSEKKIQSYMLHKKMITRAEYLRNVALRLFLQLLTPACIRGMMFRLFARKRLPKK